jgi:hypothetical protein
MNVEKISEFEYSNNDYGVITDGKDNILRKYIKAEYNPKNKQFEVKGGTKYQDVLKYRTKQEAIKAASLMGLDHSRVKRFGNRFESVWAVSLDSHHSDCFIADFE